MRSWDFFDPDFKEFFQVAEYETFIGPAQYTREQLASARVDSSGDADGDTASAASESSDGGMGAGDGEPYGCRYGRPRCAHSRHLHEPHSYQSNGSADDVVSPTDSEWSPWTALSVNTSTSDAPPSPVPFILSASRAPSGRKAMYPSICAVRRVSLSRRCAVPRKLILFLSTDTREGEQFFSPPITDYADPRKLVLVPSPSFHVVLRVTGRTPTYLLSR